MKKFWVQKSSVNTG